MKKSLTFLTAVLTLFISARGEAFSILGARPLGMGGAFVAVADEASAAYWNPAGLVEVEDLEILPFAGLSVIDRISDLAEEINDFNDNPPEDDIEYTADLRDILQGYDEEGIAAFGTPAIALLIGKKPLAVTLMELGIFGIAADLDLRPERMLDDDTFGNGIGWDDNESKILMTAIQSTDLALSYARRLTPRFSVGGSFRYLMAKKYEDVLSLPEESEAGEVIITWFEEVVEGDYVEGSGFGVDLGLLFQFNEKWQAGLLFRNLIEPEIKWKDNSDDTKFANQIRAGVAFSPYSERLLLALDIDLSEEEILDMDKRQISLGLEWWVVKNLLALRLGTYNNSGSISDNSVITGGLGLDLGAFRIDLAGGIDSAQEEAAASGSISLKL